MGVYGMHDHDRLSREGRFFNYANFSREWYERCPDPHYRFIEPNSHNKGLKKIMQMRGSPVRLKQPEEP